MVPPSFSGPRVEPGFPESESVASFRPEKLFLSAFMEGPELTAPELKPPLHNSAAPRDKEPEVDLEKLRKWQEERIARKLRGEYESANLRLAEVVSQRASHVSSHA